MNPTLKLGAGHAQIPRVLASGEQRDLLEVRLRLEDLLEIRVSLGDLSRRKWELWFLRFSLPIVHLGSLLLKFCLSGPCSVLYLPSTTLWLYCSAPSLSFGLARESSVIYQHFVGFASQHIFPFDSKSSLFATFTTDSTQKVRIDPELPFQWPHGYSALTDRLFVYMCEFITVKFNSHWHLGPSLVLTVLKSVIWTN